jgi:hypothetical protein
VSKPILLLVVKKYSVTLLAMAAAAALHISIAPAAHADDNCADEGYSYRYPLLCPVGNIAVADELDEARQRAEGLPPCYTPQGVAYYTPGDAPCA